MLDTHSFFLIPLVGNRMSAPLPPKCRILVTKRMSFDPFLAKIAIEWQLARIRPYATKMRPDPDAKAALTCAFIATCESAPTGVFSFFMRFLGHVNFWRFSKVHVPQNARLTAPANWGFAAQRRKTSGT